MTFKKMASIRDLANVVLFQEARVSALHYYGVATVSRIDKIIGLFYRIASLL